MFRSGCPQKGSIVLKSFRQIRFASVWQPCQNPGERRRFLAGTTINKHRSFDSRTFNRPFGWFTGSRTKPTLRASLTRVCLLPLGFDKLCFELLSVNPQRFSFVSHCMRAKRIRSTIQGV